jgi:hypothetical protein
MESPGHKAFTISGNRALPFAGQDGCKTRRWALAYFAVVPTSTIVSPKNVESSSEVLVSTSVGVCC